MLSPAHISAEADVLYVGLMVNTIKSETAVHGPTGSSVVMVRVTEPAVISVAEGVYVADSSVVSLKVPVPEVVHAEEVALPPLVPASVYVLPWQIAASAPAFAVAALLIVSTIVSDAAGQGPVGSFVVMARVTEPAVMSPGVEGV